MTAAAAVDIVVEEELGLERFAFHSGEEEVEPGIAAVARALKSLARAAQQ